MSEMSENGNMVRELLRLTAVGSVDDGKSTIIGRLMYDTESVLEERISKISITSDEHGGEVMKLSLLSDGLQAERNKGITIDVAYRYFATPKRKFIITDTPGHFQYTGNMISGASTANVALILIDARKGVVEQTKRHTLIASLLKIPHLVVCVNKMDLVDYREDIFELIKTNFNNFSAKLEVPDVHFVPVCALNGDNIVRSSSKMPWHTSGSLIELLETIQINNDENLTDGRFPIQCVICGRNDSSGVCKGYAGRIAGGVFRPGDHVVVLPDRVPAMIKSIDTFDGALEEAFAPMSVTIRIDKDIEVKRGDMIVMADNIPEVSHDFDIMLCWFDDKKLSPETNYIIKHTTRETTCIIKEIKYKIDINTLQKVGGATEIVLNDIARVTVSTALPLFYDIYKNNRITGSVIMIDETTNETVGAGMIL